MAFHDWNGDGKVDYKDEMIEYHNYRRFQENERKDPEPKQSKSNTAYCRISTLGAIILTVLGMLAAGAICMALHINSGILIIAIWIIMTLVFFGLYSFITGQS